MERRRALLLTIAGVSLTLGAAPACDMRRIPHAPATAGDVPAPTHARILLAASATPDPDAHGRPWRAAANVRVRVFDEQARPALDLAPGQHGILDLPAGEHVLAAVVDRAPSHLACVGALRADLAAGHVYAAHVRLGGMAKVDALIAKRAQYCVIVQFERVDREHVAAFVGEHPTSSAVRHTTRTQWSMLDDLDTAELLSGAAKLRTLHDDHLAAIPHASRLIGFAPSPAPAWSPRTSTLRPEDGVAVTP